MIYCRFLSDKDLPRLFQTTVSAFSDYLVPYRPNADTLQRKFVIEGVRLDLSVGAFDADELVGFTINAVGKWHNKLTCYDAGTGVIPNYRRQGISKRMFDFLLPVLRENKIEQYSLEVITENEPAVKLYESYNFQIARRLLVFKRSEPIFTAEKSTNKIKLKMLDAPDYDVFESFWTYYPAWQNSTDSIKRSFADERIIKTFVGAYHADELVGYGTVFHNSGNVPQIAVAEAYRRRGIGRALLNEIQSKIEKPLFVSNVDERAFEAAEFFYANGFALLTTQYEMLLKL